MAGSLTRSYGFTGANSRSAEQFPDPFADIASMAMPENIQEALRWCEFVLLKNGPYREALNRVISYFNTDIEIIAPQGQDNNIGREEKQKYLDFLQDTLGIKSVVNVVALDYLGYGNSFTSLVIPFRRYLSCRGEGCGLELPLKKIHEASQFQFRWSNYEFHAYCPHCGYNGPWRHIDRRSGEKGDIRVKRWSPHEIEVQQDFYSGDTQYIWKIPDDYRNQIRRGFIYNLERAPWEVIQAVKHNRNLLFDKDIIYHMKEESLAGLNDRGWGYSRVLTNFTHAWYVQVLHRYNEAIALDYVIPFRVITPMPRPGQGGEVNDPVLGINLGGFTSRVNQMLRERRGDPARWNVLPFPIEYKALGGDATQLAPKDLIELGMDTLLNAVGVPVQLYKGDMTLQTAPAALRLFEANWSHLVHQLNRFIAKLVEKVSQLMSWEKVQARLQRVQHADDLNRQMAKLQLMMGGQISKTTGLSTVGLEFIEEERRKLEEQRISAEETQKQQEEMDQAAQMDEMAMPQQPQQPMGAPGAAPGAAPPPGGAAPPGAPMGAMGQPAGPGGAATAFGAQVGTQPGVPATPEEWMQQADMLAQQAMGMPESQKDSFLIQLKKKDPVMHSLVSSKIEEFKQQAQVQGGQMLLEQQFPKQGSALSPVTKNILRNMREQRSSNYDKPLRRIEL